MSTSENSGYPKFDEYGGDPDVGCGDRPGLDLEERSVISVARDETELFVIYDLSVPGTWERACLHARWWGRLYVDLADIGAGRVALTFRPAPDPRWREWEHCRKRMILDDLLGEQETAA